MGGLSGNPLGIHQACLQDPDAVVLAVGEDVCDRGDGEVDTQGLAALEDRGDEAVMGCAGPTAQPSLNGPSSHGPAAGTGLVAVTTAPGRRRPQRARLRRSRRRFASLKPK